MAKRSPRLLLAAFGALALATVFFPVLRGELPVPAESGLWLIPGAPRASKNAQLSDVATQFLPLAQAVADAYRRGRLPLRSAATGCGGPLWADPLAQAAAPTAFLLLFLPVAWSFAASAALKLWLASAGAFLLLRRWRVSDSAAVLGGLAFGYSLHFGFLLFYPQTYATALLPWVLLALERLARSQRGGFAGALAAILALLLGGHPEEEFAVAAAGAAVFLLRLGGMRLSTGERLHRLARAAGAALLALGLSAVYTLPASIAVANGERSSWAGEFAAAVQPTLRLSDFLEPPVWWKSARFWIVPESQGNPRDGDSFGPGAMASRAGGYTGILLVGLAAGAFLWRRAPRGIAWARALLLAAVPYLFVYKPLHFVLAATPGLRALALRFGPIQAVVLTNLLVVFLAVRQLDRLREDRRARLAQIAVFGLLLLGALGIGVQFVAAHADRLTAWRGVSFLAPLLLISGAMTLLHRAGRRGSFRALVLFAVAGTAAELLRIDARFNPGTPPALYYPATAPVRAIQAAARGGRFATSGAELAGMAYLYGLEDVRFHDPVGSRRYERTLAAAAGYTGPGEYFQRVANLGAPVLSFLDVRAIHDSRTGETRTVPGKGIAFPDRIRGMSEEATLLAALPAERDFATTGYVVGRSESFTGSCRLAALEHPLPEVVRFRVSCGAPRLAALPEMNDGGWTAEAAGRPLPTEIVNGAFLGVRLPPGESEVVCRYVPPGFDDGRRISLWSAAVLAAIAAGSRLAPRGWIRR